MTMNNLQTRADKIFSELLTQKKWWLITGVAGFIGSNILEVLLKNDQTVVGVDSFDTGIQKNLDEVKNVVGSEKWSRF